MFVHIVFESEYAAVFNKMIAAHFDLAEHLFLIVGRSSWDEKKTFTFVNGLQIHDCSPLAVDYLLEACAGIVIHGLFYNDIVDYFYRNQQLLQKVNWIIWGGDLYFFRELGKPANPPELEEKRKVIIRQIRAISIMDDGDFRIAQEVYHTEAVHYHAGYPSMLDFDELDRLRAAHENNAETRILVGNSATYTNRHEEVFEWLSKFKDEPIRVLCPLSYGDEAYGRRISELGTAIFGEKFVPLTSFIPFAEYSRLLSTVDIAVMNHNRQQAVGNIIALRYLGKKVYVPGDVVTFRFFEQFGVPLSDARTIAQSDFSEFCRPDGAMDDESVCTRLRKGFSMEGQAERWKGIFTSMRQEWNLPSVRYTGCEADQAKGKIRLYTSDIPDKTGFTTLMIPFLQEEFHAPDAGAVDGGRFERLVERAHDFFCMTANPAEADCALLPMEWDPENPLVHSLTEKFSKLGLPLIIFYSNDSTEPIDVPNALVFRTSINRSEKRPWEFAQPGFHRDLVRDVPGMRLTLRQYQEIPVVGFCGFTLGEESVRYQALAALKNASGITTNFVIREKFWAGALGDREQMKQARTEFIGNILASDYVVCARGAGNFSFRLYETLCLGRIPVFIDSDCSLPYEFVLPWKDLCVWVDQKDVSRIGEIVARHHASLTPEEFQERQRTCRKIWEEWLSPEGFFSHFSLHFQELMKQRRQSPQSSLAPRVVSEMREHEEPVMNRLRALIEPGWVCVDVGANIGQFSELLADLTAPSGEVYAFEAHPHNAQQLRKNMASRGVGDRVMVYHAAVTDGAHPTIGLCPGRNHSSFEWNIVGHTVDGETTEAELEVPAIGLDAFFQASDRVNFVKIDVEGAAGNVFEGMRRILHEQHPVLFIEFHDDKEWASRRILLEAGYRLFDLEQNDISAAQARAYHVLASHASGGHQASASNGRSCLFVNTYYPEFLNEHYRKHPQLAARSYDAQKASLQAECFGDSDFYSSNLRRTGWEGDDIIVNCAPLQNAWAAEHGVIAKGIDVAVAQIAAARPDVVYFQNLGLASRQLIEAIRPHVGLIAGQSAYALPEGIYFQGFDLLFSSFPFYIDRFRRQGLATYFQPLAFEPRVLSAVNAQTLRRQYDISFIGGISSAHKTANETLAFVALQIPFDLWGYGKEELDPSSPLYSRHHGPVWGKDMFSLLCQSKMTINRHGDIAQNYANNMRLFEATGCGSLLLTDYKDNLQDFFRVGEEVVAYRSREELVAQLHYYRRHPDEASAIAQAGQARTLKDHTYAQRMEQTAEIFERHLRYRQEAPLYGSVDTAAVSVGHHTIGSSDEPEALTDAWKNAAIPRRQRALVQQELKEMYEGKSVAPYEVLARTLMPYVSEGASVLEIGCASGYYYEILEYLLNKRITYTGVDYSEHLIAMAQSYYPTASFITADGAALPFEDRRFEIAVSSGVLLHVPNYPAHIAETVRVADRYVVAHRTPIHRTKPTQISKKFGYGIEMVELSFNEKEFIGEWLRHGLRLVAGLEIHGSAQLDEYYMTYIFERSHDGRA